MTSIKLLLLFLATGIEFLTLANAKDCDPNTIQFTQGETIANPKNSGVSVRFKLMTECKKPVPFATTTDFKVRTGKLQRLITTEDRQEGSITKAHSVADRAIEYIELLLDTSLSISMAELTSVIKAFVKTTLSLGASFIRLTAFSGDSDQMLVLTKGCPNGYCSELAPLEAAVDNMPTLLTAWPSYDKGASAVFDSIMAATASASVHAQAHADAQFQGNTAVSTVQHLIVFTDLDDTIGSTTLSEATKFVSWLTTSSLRVSLVVLDPPPYYKDSDPLVFQAMVDAREAFASILQTNVYHSRNITRLITAFKKNVEQSIEDANSWYELFVCPSLREGTHLLSIQYCGLNNGTTCSSGELYTSNFSATGFSNTCPYEINLYPEEESKFCASRICGYHGGVFCGTCEIEVGEKVVVHEKENPIVKVPKGSIGHLDLVTWLSSSIDATKKALRGRPVAHGLDTIWKGVVVTLHAGPDHKLIKFGDAPFHGVSLTSKGIVMKEKIQDEVLIQVLNAAATQPTQWIQFNSGSTSPFVSGVVDMVTEAVSDDLTPTPTQLQSMWPAHGLPTMINVTTNSTTVERPIGAGSAVVITLLSILVIGMALFIALKKN